MATMGHSHSFKSQLKHSLNLLRPLLDVSTQQRSKESQTAGLWLLLREMNSDRTSEVSQESFTLPHVKSSHSSALSLSQVVSRP